MSHQQRAWSGLVIACGVALLVSIAGRPSAADLLIRDGGGSVGVQASGARGATPLDRLLHRVVKRTENTVQRLQTLLGDAGMIWLSLFASALVFLLVAAVSSAMDVRMLALRRMGARGVSRYLGHGTLTFLRIVRDRRTPTLARLILVVALLYWLLPVDVFPDNTLLPGAVDDVVIAVLAAKSFVYLCPESLVARHAAAVEAQTA
jgi:uncharacterized membrane protein YkvA (DUF1232 family)